MFVVESALRKLSQSTTIFSPHDQLCSDLNSLQVKSSVEYHLAKERIFRKPLMDAINNCKNKAFSTDDLLVILLAHDHLMLNTDFEELKQIDWITLLLQVIDAQKNKDLLLRLLRFLQNGHILKFRDQVPLILLNSLVKELESGQQEQIIWALKVTKEFCNTCDCNSVLLPKLLSLLASSKINNATKSFVIKVLSQFDCADEEVERKLSEDAKGSSAIQSALQSYFPSIKLDASNLTKSASTVINLKLGKDNSNLGRIYYGTVDKFDGLSCTELRLLLETDILKEDIERDILKDDIVVLKESKEIEIVRKLQNYPNFDKESARIQLQSIWGHRSTKHLQ